MPPTWVLRVVAFVSEIASSVSGSAPMITGDLLDDAGGRMPLFDCKKAREKLGLAPRDAEEIIVDTIRWALFQGWLPKMPAEYRDKLPPDPEWRRRVPARSAESQPIHPVGTSVGSPSTKGI